MFRYKLSPKSARLLSMALSVAISVFLVVAIVEAATTISTNIVTNGTLTVDTTSTLTGDVTAGADLIVTSGARVGTGSTGTHLTAVAADTLFVEGQGEFDGIVWFDGSLRASSTALLTGAVTTYGAVTLGDAAGDAIVITGNASTTNSLTVGNNFYVNGYATTTGTSGNFETAGTLTVVGQTTLASASSTRLSIFTNLLVGGTATTTIAGDNTASTITYASTTAISATSASSTELIVGGNSANGTLAGLIHGTCNIVQRSLTATTTGGFACTGATGITTSFKVFVQATSTLAGTLATGENAGFPILAASSTGNNVIGVEISNLTGANRTPAGTLNFWAVR